MAWSRVAEGSRGRERRKGKSEEGGRAFPKNDPIRGSDSHRRLFRVKVTARALFAFSPPPPFPFPFAPLLRLRLPRRGRRGDGERHSRRNDVPRRKSLPLLYVSLTYHLDQAAEPGSCARLSLLVSWLFRFASNYDQ